MGLSNCMHLGYHRVQGTVVPVREV